jgi:hypothetical protein
MFSFDSEVSKVFLKVARAGLGSKPGIFLFHLFSHSITLPLSHSGSPKRKWAKFVMNISLAGFTEIINVPYVDSKRWTDLFLNPMNRLNSWRDYFLINYLCLQKNTKSHQWLQYIDDLSAVTKCNCAKTEVHENQGSMLWSQFSAIFGNFLQKIGVFLKNQCYDQNFG